MTFWKTSHKYHSAHHQEGENENNEQLLGFVIGQRKGNLLRNRGTDKQLYDRRDHKDQQQLCTHDYTTHTCILKVRRLYSLVKLTKIRKVLP
ncbi:hypothetical protein PaecuDRAFT_0853 [Paenibacillus curdlanolyticus YK9]|uniref:Uncharacterized protein n=1 Tax=Paenibacillus curdlanolyticus YK9 TaxID=717606 RepID=E0I5D1_9BACL|nr:hypothetical protein PaecuDRAFT_0853 [Paenibacillus curdlanolyticus YK9]